MQAERWNRIERLYEAARAVPLEKRGEFLKQACPDDAELREEVQSLLDQHTGGFLESAPVPAVKTLRAGVKLGHFEIVELIGRGGMGEVYRARDSRLKRGVAIKVLPAGLAHDPDRIARFEREARAASALNHPNIVAVYDIGCDNGTYWIASELVGGDTLRRSIEAGPLPSPTVIEIATQVAAGLAAAHAAGLVHRDLKPDNIMITPDGHVKILDFGLAKQRRMAPGSTTADLTDEDAVLGTAGYMSPEQVRSEPVDHRSDLFSFGVVLYEMLCGKRAFAGDSSVEVMNAILKEEPPELPASVPPGLERIVRRCLEKEPSRRFQSAADLGFALNSVSASQPARFAARKKLAWLTRGIVVAASVAAAATAGFWLAHPLPPPRVIGPMQITNDGKNKWDLHTDGARLYFGSDGGIFEVGVKGGDPVRVRGSRTDLLLMDLSPDHSELLVRPVDSPTGSGRVGDTAAIMAYPAAGGPLRRLGELTAYDANWSPNGDQLVYTKGSEVHIARSDGTELRKVATVDGRADFPRWSPDGSRIRFSINSSVLWEVSVDGSHLRRVFPNWKGSTCCGNWTADGKYFLFVAEGDIWAVRERPGLFGRGGSEPVRLTGGPMDTDWPVPSPDGKRIFFIGSLNRVELVRYDARTSVWALYMSGIPALNLDFSPDGKSVAYVSYPDRSLSRSNIDGSEREQIVPRYVSGPRWSPDGKQIAFFSQTPGTPYRVHVIPAEGGASVQLTHGEAGSEGEIDPSWSPDAGSLVFSGPYPGTAQGVLRTIDMKTHRISVLPGSEGLWSPRWSPNGRFIAALSYQGSLMLYDLEKHQQTELAPGAAWPNWSRDNQYVYFRGPGERWSRVRLHDRKLEQLASLRGLKQPSDAGAWAAMAPDGSVLSVRGTVTPEIYALDWEAP